MNKYAILIGNSQFPDEPSREKNLPDLACPEKDVDGLAKVLASERGEFDVLPLKNKPHYEILDKLQDVVNQAKQEDLLLIYYSGHGKPNKAGILHLTTFDTVVNKLESRSIPIHRIYDIIGTNRKLNKIVIILDCCYSGAAGQGFKGAVDDQLQQLNNARGTYLVTASTELQVAHESAAEGLSLFTKHLIAGLDTGEADRDGDGWVSMNELYDYVQGKVVAENPKQHPTEHVKDKRGMNLLIAKSGKKSSKKPSFEDLAKEREANKQQEELRKFGFILNEGSAFDPQSELMWLRFSLGEHWEKGKPKGKAIKYDYNQAIQAVIDFNKSGGYAGYTDWKLPSIEEINSLKANNIYKLSKKGDTSIIIALFTVIKLIELFGFMALIGYLKLALDLSSSITQWIFIVGMIPLPLVFIYTEIFIRNLNLQVHILSFSSQEVKWYPNEANEIYVFDFHKYWTETKFDYQKSKSFSLNSKEDLTENFNLFIEYIEPKSTKNFVTLVRYSK